MTALDGTPLIYNRPEPVHGVAGGGLARARMPPLVDLRGARTAASVRVTQPCGPLRHGPGARKIERWRDDAPRKQLLHLVFGGELTTLDATEFKDLTSSTSSASIRTTPPPMRPGRPRRSRPSTTRRCATSSSTCTGCSIPRHAAPRRAERGRIARCSGNGLARSPGFRRTLGTLAARLSAAGRARPTRWFASSRRTSTSGSAGAAAHHRDVARPAFPDAVRAQTAASGQGADLAPPRRRDQRDRGRAARRRHDPRLRRTAAANSIARAASPAFAACWTRSTRATTSR